MHMHMPEINPQIKFILDLKTDFNWFWGFLYHSHIYNKYVLILWSENIKSPFKIGKIMMFKRDVFSLAMQICPFINFYFFSWLYIIISVCIHICVYVSIYHVNCKLQLKKELPFVIDSQFPFENHSVVCKPARSSW